MRGAVREHLASGASPLDFRLHNAWQRGRSADQSGPVLISFTEYRPHVVLDLFDINREGNILADMLVDIDGAVGVMTYLQPRWLRGGSLSVWRTEEAMRKFIRLPYHVEIMKAYRSRGVLRATRWWADGFAIGKALAEGQSRVEAGGLRAPASGSCHAT